MLAQLVLLLLTLCLHARSVRAVLDRDIYARRMQACMARKDAALRTIAIKEQDNASPWAAVARRCRKDASFAAMVDDEHYFVKCVDDDTAVVVPVHHLTA